MKKSSSRKPKVKGRLNSRKKRLRGNRQSVKQTQFVSEGQPPAINEKGLELEKISIIIKYTLLGIFALLGVILCIFDIRDDGLILKFLGLFNYSGTLVGVIITVACMYWIYKSKPSVFLKR